MLNKILIHGYLGKEPELEEINGNNGPFTRAKFSVGVSRDYGDDTDWFNCVAYGKRAEVIGKYLHRGSEILAEGRMESYTMKDNRKGWSLNVSGFNFCGKARTGVSSTYTEEAPAGFIEVEEPFDLF